MRPPAGLLRADISAAHGRLRGQLVAAPLIGGLDLPGFAVPSDLRLKAEVLQPSGSLWFRGAMHWAMRQLGRHKGVRIDGAPRAVLAWACAAREARLEVHAPGAAAWSPDIARAVAHYGAVAEDAAGFVEAPGIDAPEFAAGVASVVIELLDELPHDTRRLVVAPAVLARLVAWGVEAMGRAWQVVPGPDRHPRAEAVQAVLLGQHRLGCDLEGAAALASAVASGICQCRTLPRRRRTDPARSPVAGPQTQESLSGSRTECGRIPGVPRSKARLSHRGRREYRARYPTARQSVLPPRRP
jgi:hypothetical protein